LRVNKRERGRWEEYQSHADRYRQELRRYSERILKRDEAVGRAYQGFIGEMLSLFGDRPPVSWAWMLRRSDGRRECPVFRVYDQSTGYSKSFLYVWDRRLEVIHFDEQYRHLFPQKKCMHGLTDGVEFDRCLFDRGHGQDEYIAAVKAILRGNPSISLNFPSE
jgi:hypothetical protein